MAASPLPDPVDLVPNILAVWNQSTGPEHEHGSSWYPVAHDFARTLASDNGLCVEQSAGILAALSPRLPWYLNVRYARQLAETGVCPGLRANVSKAQRIRLGETPDSVLARPHKAPAQQGSKVRAFYRCILDPQDRDTVCVDRHAFDVALGARHDEHGRSPLERKGFYDTVSGAYISAAEYTGTIPSELQAVTWLTWRRIHAAANHRFHSDAATPNPALEVLS